ncbi:MAG: PLP-dependent aminotransferase family protein [bacterium]|nr:PLP-dependent aminotransferase family protein [bacterium]
METLTQQLLCKNMKALPPSFIKGMLKVTQDPEIISFSGGLPSPLSFPMEALGESMARATERYGTKLFQYSLTAGIPELREFIAARCNEKYGLGVTPADILITTGSQQALDLIAKITLDPGDGVIVEEPGYLGALQTFMQYAPTFHPVTLNEEGLDVAGLAAALEAPRLKFIYTVPNFQNPTGLTYSIENRNKVYETIKDKNVILIEDDPYGELRFDGKTLPYIAAGRYDNCILLGSFSKTATPGMRVGYLVCKNAELLEAIATAKESSDVHTSVLSQYVLYDYLTHNDYDGHIAEIRALYQSQCSIMLDAMAECFPASVSYTKPDGGMFIWCTLPEGRTALDFFYQAVERKVAVAPGDPFYVAPKAVRTFRLNYTNASPDEIREGIRRIGALL